MSESLDELLTHNQAYAKEQYDGQLDKEPVRHLAVVTCMDARLDVHAMLGLRNGEAHILRNAGGVITDDVIRSLCLSQRYLGTNEVVLIHHTKCGLQGLDEESFRAELSEEMGETPPWPLQSFDDPFDDVRASVARIKESVFVGQTEDVSGFVYDVDDGLLHSV